MDSVEKIWTVSELTRLVKDVLEQTFYPFWISGEISNLTIHRSGHVYFSLKDARSQVQCVFFRGAQKARDLGLAEGMSVETQGRLTVYEPRGNYQLTVSQLRPKGKGGLQQAFEELKAKLRAEGLFDDERKRPVPALPARIGVVTSPSGAAIRDFLNVLNRRFSGMNVRIFPAAVQGQRAAGEIVQGIRHFNREGGVDVIVVTRGGGSLEDLWPFNEEAVARAIAESAIPVISGVGHEVDFTISDLVADLRVPTPSAAAELVVKGRAELQEKVRALSRRLGSAARLSLGEWRRRVERSANSPVFTQAGQTVRTLQQRLDEAVYRLETHAKQAVQQNKARHDRMVSALRAMDPKAVLTRGYSVLFKESGEAVRSPRQVTQNESLRALLADGELTLKVDGDES